MVENIIKKGGYSYVTYIKKNTELVALVV